MRQLYSTGQVAQLLGIQRHRIEYAVTAGYVADTRVRFLGKRCWRLEDVQRIAAHFRVEVPRGGSDVPV